MRAVDGLRLDRRVPPRVEQHHVARRRQVEPGAAGLERDQEHAWPGFVLERRHQLVAFPTRAGEHVVRDATMDEACAQALETLHELREHQHLLALIVQRLDELPERVELAGAGGVRGARERGMAADLAQARELGEDRDLPALQALHVHRHGRDHVARLAHLGQVQLALQGLQVAIEALFDALGKVARDLALQAPHEHRPHARREQATHERWRIGALVATPELLLGAEQAGVHERHDAPQVERAVLERRAGERQAMPRTQLARGLTDRRHRVLDVLRLVQHGRAQFDLAPRLDVAPQQCVVGHQQVVRVGVRQQVAASRAALEHGHAQPGRKTFGLAAPVVHDRRRRHDQRRPERGIVLAQVQQPHECLHGLAQAHVVGQNRAHAERGRPRQEVHAFALVGPQLALEPAWHRLLGDALERRHFCAQMLDRGTQLGCCSFTGQQVPGAG